MFSFCERRFFHQNDFTKHYREQHTNEKPFKCTRCAYETKRKFDLKQHFVRLHEDIELKSPLEYCCPRCEYTCFSKSVLKSHVNKKHTEDKDKPFNCTYCESKYLKKYDLKMHMARAHLGLKPFECSLCEYKCTTKFGLNSHLSRIHTMRNFS